MRSAAITAYGRRLLISAFVVAVAFSPGAHVASALEPANPAALVGKDLDVGQTGFAVKRPVLASACPHACPWGELGEFVQSAMRPLGYDVLLCRNCNGAKGPGLVSGARRPPPLTAEDLRGGTNERVEAPVDFGITESGFLSWAYNAQHMYEKDGPYRNLRLIARIEDPYYLLVAVKADSGITDLAQIKAGQLRVRILATEFPTTQPVLDYYGLSKQAVESWGASFVKFRGPDDDYEFDVIISDLGAPTNNPESAYWPRLTQKHELRFLQLPEELLSLLSKANPGMVRATARWGLLRGIDRPIATVARSGEVVFGRTDTPDQAAYDAARAIDEHQDELKWFARPYSYDPKTAWKSLDIPLHPGAQRYYREKGYMK